MPQADRASFLVVESSPVPDHGCRSGGASGSCVFPLEGRNGSQTACTSELAPGADGSRQSQVAEDQHFGVCEFFTPLSWRIGTQQRREANTSGPGWGLFFRVIPTEHFRAAAPANPLLPPLPALLVKLFLFIARKGGLLVFSSLLCFAETFAFFSCPKGHGPHLVCWRGRVRMLMGFYAPLQSCCCCCCKGTWGGQNRVEGCAGSVPCR